MDFIVLNFKIYFILIINIIWDNYKLLISGLKFEPITSTRGLKKRFERFYYAFFCSSLFHFYIVQIPCL